MREIFFRDDDADRDLPELRRLLQLFEVRNASLNLAVIPGTVDADCASLLLDQGAWLEIHQHGWMHTNHELTGRKCEFGAARSRQMQHADLSAGQQRMNEAFGQRWVPIFTPPWNRCVRETHQVLHELGFAAISQTTGATLADSPLAQVPVTVDIFTWKQGPRLKPLTQVMDELAAAPASEATGVLLHHKVMSGEAFDLLEQIVDSVAAASVRRMSELVPAREAACRI